MLSLSIILIWSQSWFLFLPGGCSFLVSSYSNLVWNKYFPSFSCFLYIIILRFVLFLIPSSEASHCPRRQHGSSTQVWSKQYQAAQKYSGNISCSDLDFTTLLISLNSFISLIPTLKLHLLYSLK